MPFLKNSLFLISFWKTGTSRAACSSQDWDHEKGHLLRFLSVTPFGDSLQWPYLNVIYSVVPLLLRIWNDLWPFEDCYLLGFVFALFFFFFYCLKLPCMKIYKHAFLQTKHSRLVSLETWVPCIPLLVDSSPQVPVYKNHDRVIENLKIKINK